MNQEKIGKFIQECRKNKNLTQEELATKLGVTNKSVSKWERGINLPDYSLFESLCNELGITINELIAGERIENDNIQNKFNDNIVDLMKYNKNKINNIVSKIFICLIILICIIYFSYKGYLLYKVNSYKTANEWFKRSETYKINPNNCANRSISGFYKLRFCLNDDFLEEDMYTGAVIYKNKTTDSLLFISHHNDKYNKFTNYLLNKNNNTIFTNISKLNENISNNIDLNNEVIYSKNDKLLLINNNDYIKGALFIRYVDNYITLEGNIIINNNSFNIILSYNKDYYSIDNIYDFINSISLSD